MFPDNDLSYLNDQNFKCVKECATDDVLPLVCMRWLSFGHDDIIPALEQ